MMIVVGGAHINLQL